MVKGGWAGEQQRTTVPSVKPHPLGLKFFFTLINFKLVFESNTHILTVWQLILKTPTSAGKDTETEGHLNHFVY